LRERLVELLADRAMVADQPVPRTKDEFQSLLDAGRERIGWAVQELVAIMGPIFEGYHQACLAIEELESTAGGSNALVLRGVPVLRKNKQDAAAPPRWQYALDDIRQQIDRLMDPASFSKTPWDWLKQYPRYFRAICHRLENLPGATPRDLEKYQEFQPRWQLYLDYLRDFQAQGVLDAELTHYRWMLEEYRVSLFAQKLGTAIPVSPKRLEQQWAKVQG
jgi:ATP-dependent helicase HrpA